MSKNKKSIIIVIAGLFLVYLIYSVYFTAKEGTGSFNDFDINSTANKTIKVEIVKEKGFLPGQGGGVTFFAKDKTGIEKKITFDKELPQEVKDAKVIVLLGHLHGDYFHAAEVESE